MFGSIFIINSVKINEIKNKPIISLKELRIALYSNILQLKVLGEYLLLYFKIHN